MLDGSRAAIHRLAPPTVHLIQETVNVGIGTSWSSLFAGPISSHRGPLILLFPAAEKMAHDIDQNDDYRDYEFPTVHRMSLGES
jgi:hypothetical protein